MAFLHCDYVYVYLNQLNEKMFSDRNHSYRLFSIVGSFMAS